VGFGAGAWARTDRTRNGLEQGYGPRKTREQTTDFDVAWNERPRLGRQDRQLRFEKRAKANRQKEQMAR